MLDVDASPVRTNISRAIFLGPAGDEESGSSQEKMTMHYDNVEPPMPLLAGWIALIAALTVGGSLAFACAAPLAAIAALASLTMRQVEGIALVVMAWLANQLVGFAIPGYPLDLSTFGWGRALGAGPPARFPPPPWAG